MYGAIHKECMQEGREGEVRQNADRGHSAYGDIFDIASSEDFKNLQNCSSELSFSVWQRCWLDASAFSPSRVLDVVYIAQCSVGSWWPSLTHSLCTKVSSLQMEHTDRQNNNKWEEGKGKRVFVKRLVMNTPLRRRNTSDNNINVTSEISSST